MKTSGVPGACCLRRSNQSRIKFAWNITLIKQLPRLRLKLFDSGPKIVSEIMNKYLRQFLIASRVPAFVRIGYQDLRRKFHARHHDFQLKIKEWLFPEQAPVILNGPLEEAFSQLFTMKLPRPPSESRNPCGFSLRRLFQLFIIWSSARYGHRLDYPKRNFQRSSKCVSSI